MTNYSNQDYAKEQLLKYVFKVLELKTLEFMLINNKITINDVSRYFLEVILVDKQVQNINELAFYVFNINYSKLIEFMNAKAVINSDTDLSSYKDMFK